MLMHYVKRCHQMYRYLVRVPKVFPMLLKHNIEVRLDTCLM